MTQKRKETATSSSSKLEGVQPVFAALRGLLLPYKDALEIVRDDPDHLYLNCPGSDAKGNSQFFGAVKVSGRKHLLHFMPVYDFPELLGGVTPALKKRMQGKSCFNFHYLEPAMVAELEELIAQGVARYRSIGKL